MLLQKDRLPNLGKVVLWRDCRDQLLVKCHRIERQSNKNYNREVEEDAVDLGEGDPGDENGAVGG